MRPIFHHRLVNGPYEDPCLYVRLLREGRAMLFDAGNIQNLAQRDILKISDVFVTHTHIDHFIGFDTILRTVLRHEGPLRVYGPANIIECVEGKLAGYSWNLIEDYPVGMEVHAVDGGVVRKAGFYAGDRFSRRDLGVRPFEGTLLEEGGLKVGAVELDHGISCLGFSLEEEYHINIDKAALEGMGLGVGPWLSGLKQAIREGREDSYELEAGEGTMRLGELRRIAMITRGQKITYIADAAPSEQNLQAIADFARGSDVLYCEAYFLDEDRERALDRKHLTAGDAARAAREAGVGALVVMHFSPKYLNSGVTPKEEAMRVFGAGEGG